MKSSINQNYINIYYAFLLILSISKINSISYINPIATTLSNNNLLIIHKEGISICDKDFNQIRELFVFTTVDEQITTDNLSKVIISKFNEEYIFCSKMNI